MEMTPRMKRRLPLLVLGGVAAAAALVSLFGDIGIVSTWRLRGTERQLVEENARLREEIAALRQEVVKLRTNPSYIEEIARKELGLVGEKENVIVLERKADPAPAGAGKSRP